MMCVSGESDEGGMFNTGILLITCAVGLLYSYMYSTCGIC